MILIIDNYDSFVYNLARYVVELGFEATVFRNDKLSIDEISAMSPSHIIISPGPCTPNEAGISLQLIDAFMSSIPILGVCLGHQAIAQACGANVVQAKSPKHGKADKIYHDGEGIFHLLPNPLTVARYHSLIVEPESVPSSLIITAKTQNDEIMGLRHQSFPLVGVQFHPESVLTEHGHNMLGQFLGMRSLL